MYKYIINILLLLTFLFISSGLKSQDKDSSFHIGIASKDITPPIGFPSYNGKSTGISSPLFAKAIVFQQKNVKGAILICDLIYITKELSEIVRKTASAKTGIHFQNISICATHTHTGPRISIAKFIYQEETDTLVKADSANYISFLIKNMIDAILVANNQLQKVELISGIGEVNNLSFNRRYLMTNGKVRCNPGHQNREIVYPVGPIDPTVHFILVRPFGQSTITGALTVFACHADTHGGTEFHGDYPYFLEQNLEQIFGKTFISVFGMGTSGDINSADVSKSKSERGYHAQQIGHEIGIGLSDAIKKESSSAIVLEPELSVVSKTIYLPVQDFSNEDYIWATNKKSNSLYNEREELTNRRRTKIINIDNVRKKDAIPPSVSGGPWRLPIEIQVFRLSDETAIVTLPGEIFVELGLDLKKRSPFLNTIIIELANANISYVPTLKAFTEGDYEPVNSLLAPGSGEKIVDEAVKILNDLKSVH